jgi:hypothetical protein
VLVRLMVVLLWVRVPRKVGIMEARSGWCSMAAS